MSGSDRKRSRRRSRGPIAGATEQPNELLMWIQAELIPMPLATATAIAARAVVQRVVTAGGQSV